MTPGCASHRNGIALTAATAVLSINTVITSCPGWPNRIVASTYFVDGRNGIVVDGTTLTGTYTLTVIGPGNTMRTALTIPGGVSDSVGRAGGTVVVDGPGTVKVEALHPAANLRNAKPAE